MQNEVVKVMVQDSHSSENDTNRNKIPWKIECSNSIELIILKVSCIYLKCICEV